MRSSTDQPEYLAVARIREVIEPESLFVCTARGSALDEVPLPVEGRLFWPRSSQASGPSASPGDSLEDLAPAYLGPGAGKGVAVTLTEKKIRRHHYLLRLQLHQNPGASSFVGAWLLFPRLLLDRSPGLFFYQIRHLPVRRHEGEEPVGRIVDYLETGANGVIVVEANDGAEILIPLVDEFVELDVQAGRVLVPLLDEFR